MTELIELLNETSGIRIFFYSIVYIVTICITFDGLIEISEAIYSNKDQNNKGNE